MSPEDGIYLCDHWGPGLGGQQAVTPVTDDVRSPGAGAGVCADGRGARAAGGPPLPQQLRVKVGMALGVFTENRKMYNV